MRTIYIDCSYLSEHPHLNTGIQRVVRNVVENFSAMGAERGYQIRPVRISNGHFDVLDIADLYPKVQPRKPSEAAAHVPAPAPTLPWALRAKRYLIAVYNTGREFAAALLGNGATVRRFLFAPRTQLGLTGILYTIAIRPWRKPPVVKVEEAQRPAFDGVTSDDILLLLDSTWYSNIWPSVEEVKSRGAHVVAVNYDLIPITHRQFCDDFLASTFKEWFVTSLRYVDGYVGISKTVRDELYSFMVANHGDIARSKKYEFFLLGADFRPSSTDMAPRKVIQSVFEARPTYIIVSTVEPRKNHQYLLYAFHSAWKRGLDINLVIIGRMGWKVEHVVAQMRESEYYENKLFYFDNVTDDELNYCYKNARMLVFPSIVEGFGLPIVESLAHGLPVIASDIPVHREVGGEQVAYVDLNDPMSLVTLLEEIERKGLPDRLKVPEDYKWLSWSEASTMLLDKIEVIAGRGRRS